MTHTKTKFTKDFEAAQQAGISYHGMAHAVNSFPAEQAWDIYQNTRSAPLRMQIFGRHIFDAHEQVIKFARSVPSGTSAQIPDAMVAITPTELDNFGKTNANKSGSALKTDRGSWNMTINDVWVCGGAHSTQEFHPASRIKSYIIFNQQHVLTITGRELVGLALAGYIPVSGHKDLGKIYRPSITKKVEDLNLVDYQVTIASLKTVWDVQNFFASKGYDLA